VAPLCLLWTRSALVFVQLRERPHGSGPMLHAVLRAWDGVGSVPLSGVYRRHEPEKTVLRGIVREHLETFLARARAPTRASASSVPVASPSGQGTLRPGSWIIYSPRLATANGC